MSLWDSLTERIQGGRDEHPGADDTAETIAWLAAMRRPVGRVPMDAVNTAAQTALHCRLLAARARRRTRLWLRRTHLVAPTTTAKEAL